jgi:hypothetical protein
MGASDPCKAIICSLWHCQDTSQLYDLGKSLDHPRPSSLVGIRKACENLTRDRHRFKSVCAFWTCLPRPWCKSRDRSHLTFHIGRVGGEGLGTRLWWQCYNSGHVYARDVIHQFALIHPTYALLICSMVESSFLIIMRSLALSLLMCCTRMACHWSAPH